MTTTNSGIFSQPPTVKVEKVKKTPLSERDKYVEMWKHDEYRKFSPGEQLANKFLSWARPPKDSTIIDFGCGTGRGSLMISLLSGCKMIMLDFAENCLDEDVREAVKNQGVWNEHGERVGDYLKFYVQDLTELPEHRAKYGYCTDVMEHIPEEDVEKVLRNITKSAEKVFFNISLLHDSCGKLIGEDLHLTVKPAGWWIQKFRDLDCVIYNSETYGTDLLVYVSAWNDASELVKRGTLNTTEEKMVENVRVNTSKGYTQVHPYNKNDLEIMILGGGPSLLDFKDEIIRKRKAGMAIVTTNGAYNEVLSWGITPSAQVVVDSRPFNKRFLEPVIPHCKYMLASQCDPSMFEGIPHDQIYLWHAALNESVEKALDEAYQGEWYPVPGGSTVMLRTITLFRLLGYAKMHIYGFDSCLRDDKHHAYEQKENDDKQEVTVTIGNKLFLCHAWMASQAQEFMDQMKLLSDEVELAVYGDGLIAEILKQAASDDAVELVLKDN